MTDGIPGDMPPGSMHTTPSDGIRTDKVPGVFFLARAKRHPCTFQERVEQWMQATFGPKISADTTERNHRFLEESIELVQACGCTPSEAHQLVDYVFNRPIGERSQEIGGVMVTLAALCESHNMSMRACGEAELIRCWHNMKKIRAKQAAKPKHSPLPEHTDRKITINTNHPTHQTRLNPWPRKNTINTNHLNAIDNYAAANSLMLRIEIMKMSWFTGCSIREARRRLEWREHPLYQWGRRKIGAA